MSVGLIAVRIDDLPNIATAFGNEIARDIAVASRNAIRAGAAPLAVIGDVSSTSMMICATVTSAADARQQAAEVATAIFDALRALSDSVIPVVGVGVATTDVFGYDAEALAEAADEASRRSSTSTDVGVLFAEPPATTGGLAVVES
jgi:O-acetyl-ADP-ribose deacetylase (regulator of RNase III)